MTFIQNNRVSDWKKRPEVLFKKKHTSVEVHKVTIQWIAVDKNHGKKSYLHQRILTIVFNSWLFYPLVGGHLFNLWRGHVNSTSQKGHQQNCQEDGFFPPWRNVLNVRRSVGPWDDFHHQEAFNRNTNQKRLDETPWFLSSNRRCFGKPSQKETALS